jgi:hypothetical protein
MKPMIFLCAWIVGCTGLCLFLSSCTERANAASGCLSGPHGSYVIRMDERAGTCGMRTRVVSWNNGASTDPGCWGQLWSTSSDNCNWGVRRECHGAVSSEVLAGQVHNTSANYEGFVGSASLTIYNANGSVNCESGYLTNWGRP